MKLNFQKRKLPLTRRTKKVNAEELSDDMLDEANSALDNITQKIVSDSLEKLECTRIVIAYRLSTIKHFDRIIVLDNNQNLCLTLNLVIPRLRPFSNCGIIKNKYLNK